MRVKPIMPVQSIEPVLFCHEQLHGVFCAPVGKPRASVLVVSPLFEEKRCAYRALLTCARALADAGAAALLPDLYATGNSAGTLAEISLDRWQSDLQAAAAWLRERVDGPLYVVGCRAGALLAAQAIADGMAAERLLLWQPVVSGRSYLSQLRTRRMVQEKMTGEEPVEVGKYEVEGQQLSAELYQALEGLRLPATPPPISTRFLQCSFNEKLLSEYDKLLTPWGEACQSVRCLTIEPFWNPHTPGLYSELAGAFVEEVLA